MKKRKREKEKRWEQVNGWMPHLAVLAMAQTRPGVVGGGEVDLIFDVAAVAAAGVEHGEGGDGWRKLSRLRVMCVGGRCERKGVWDGRRLGDGRELEKCCVWGNGKAGRGGMGWREGGGLEAQYVIFAWSEVWAYHGLMGL